MNFVELNEQTFLLFAAKKYDRSVCIGIDEFYKDLERIAFVKRLLRRYEKTQQLSERLILNHLISLWNVFGDASVPMLFFRIDEDLWPKLKTFLVFLDYLPTGMRITNSVTETDIPLDTHIINILRRV